MMRISILACLPALVMMTGCDWQSGGTSPAPVWAREATIEALGRAYIEVLPNRAEFSVTYQGRGLTAAEAGALATARANLAADVINQLSDDEARITSSVRIHPFYRQVTVRVDEFEERLVENEHPDSLLGYIADATVEVRSSDLARIALLRGGAMAVGPAQATPVSFSLEPNVETQQAAFEAAVADATARAGIVARVSDNGLGPLLLLREGGQSCLGQEYGAPGQDTARNQMDGFDVLTVTASRRPRGVSELLAATGVTDEALRDGTVDVGSLVEAAQDFALSSDFSPQRLQSRVCAVFAVR
ncbi:SIMPL domain-containing protein [Maricaulis sp.]|uniref:SIMPL domain-containing protein n=1 Tax=Maricaulis sp. TaxID=1486257 RepID=UPI003A9573EC